MAVIDGTEGDDELTGTADTDIINGYGGRHTIHGGDGNDWRTRQGGPGQAIGGNVDDVLTSGKGFNEAPYGKPATTC